jgi:hypothetical protein
VLRDRTAKITLHVVRKRGVELLEGREIASLIREHQLDERIA